MFLTAIISLTVGIALGWFGYKKYGAKVETTVDKIQGL